MRKPATAVVAVFVISIFWFGLNVEHSGIASVYCDPVSSIGTQDEAVYASEAIEMVMHGGWLTPTYLGRYALNKPPLLQWLAAISARIFGISAWALRIPSLLAAATVTALVFAWVWKRGSPLAGVAAAVLLASSHFFYTFARLCMLDMLLTCWLWAAAFALMQDPKLARVSSRWIFGACSGAAILTKGAAGFIPLIALLIYVVIARKDMRPKTNDVLAISLVAAVIALPWHLYQLVLHAPWFIKEYVITQHFLVGVTAPPQYSNENHLLFYARRLFLTDPVLTVTASASLLVVLRKWRRHAVLLAWSSALVLALFAFRYRSAYYVLPLIPPMAILSGTLIAGLPGRAQVLAAIAVGAYVVLKVTSASLLWGLQTRTTFQSSAPSLENYCRAHRGNGLIIVDPHDEFYSSALPLAHVRYVIVSPAPRTISSGPLDFGWLGISVTVPQFQALTRWSGIFMARLASYGITKGDPIATVIWAHSPAEVVQLIESHPEADFSIPETLEGLPAWRLHAGVPAGAGRVFLFSSVTSPFQPTRACGF